MKQKLAIAVIALAVGSLGTTGSFAGEPKPPSKTVAKAPKMQHMELSLSGVTAENRAEIEKFAHESGAKQASLNPQTGDLKISVPEGKTFDRETFTKKLEEKAPSVSLK